MPPLTSDRGRLRIEFMYRGVRCREYLDLKDTAANRKEKRQWEREFTAALHRPDFDYATWFPRSKRAAKFSAPKRAIPTLGEYFETWLDTLEISKATRADYAVLKSVFLDRTFGGDGHANRPNKRTLTDRRGVLAAGRSQPQPDQPEDRDKCESGQGADQRAVATNSLGSRLITEVTATDIREVIKPYIAAGQLRRPTMFLQRMKAMYASAIEDGLCERNPALNIRNPKSRVRKEPVEPFSRAEEARILEAANDTGRNPLRNRGHLDFDERSDAQPRTTIAARRPERLKSDAQGTRQDYNLIVVMLGTGIGPGEAGALRRKDIDLKRRRMSISGSYGRFGEGPTKTTSRTRIIELSNEIVPVIEALKSQMATVVRPTSYPRATPIDSPLFLGQKGRHLNFMWWRRRVWTPLLEAAKVKYRSPYALRHTFAVRMLEAGFDPVTIARQMGHTSTEMIHGIYGRWTNRPEKASSEN